MLTLKICVGVFSGIFKARMLKLGIHRDNELLYCGIENQTPCLSSSRTSMAGTPLGPGKLVRDRDSSSQ